jgi:hypothetical protein
VGDWEERVDVDGRADGRCNVEAREDVGKIFNLK